MAGAAGGCAANIQTDLTPANAIQFSGQNLLGTDENFCPLGTRDSWQLVGVVSLCFQSRGAPRECWSGQSSCFIFTIKAFTQAKISRYMHGQIRAEDKDPTFPDIIPLCSAE